MSRSVARAAATTIPAPKRSDVPPAATRDSVSTTIIMTMPIVPGRKKSESRISGLKRTRLSIRMGGSRIGGAGLSGSSSCSALKASPSVRTRAPYIAACAKVGQRAPRNRDENHAEKDDASTPV